MNGISNILTGHVLKLLTGATGVNAVLESAEIDSDVHMSPVRTFAVQNAAPDLTERTLQGKYPAVLVYCDRLANTLKEKFRVFSGTARVCVEVRCSQDRLEGLDSNLQRYTDFACQVLEFNRGAWSGGLYYAGGYEVVYGPVRSGGNFFLQSAKISFEVEVSR